MVAEGGLGFQALLPELKVLGGALSVLGLTACGSCSGAFY